ncbi:MAG: tetratricopeptide repeat-containing glycosyltransferase family protein [Xanthobacteraceae bacterium]
MKAPPSFLMQEATALHREGQLVEAAARYEQVIAQEKRNADAMFLLATVHCQLGRLTDGIETARKAIKIDPKYAPAYNLVGVAQQQLGRTELALNNFDRAVAADPRFAEAWFNRALNLLTLGRRNHAIESFDRSIALQPNHALARHGRGTVLMLDDRNEAALSDFTAAVALDPNLPQALANRGYLLNRLGRFEEAFADLERALAMAPNDDDVRYHAALVELLHGRWREGFEHYEARLTARSLDTTRTFVPPAYPRWNGEPPDGNLLVLFTEQGRGDVIQFARFATELSKSGHRVAIATQPAYASMFASVAGIERVIVDTDELASLAPLRWQMLVSVPGSLGLTPDTIPASVPYLAADPTRRSAWQKKLGGGFKIGISWQGSPTFVHDRGRSIPLAAFVPLADVPDVRLISLQKRPGAEQIANVPFRGRIEQVLDVSDTGDNAFLDTVALVDTLDLVVTSDSMNAHLTGALGKPAFVALRKIPDWRWLTGREDCPWYPSARLFRQTTDGDWQDVFRRIAVAASEAAGWSAK